MTFETNIMNSNNYNNGYASVNYRQPQNSGSDVFNGPYQIQTPNGIVHTQSSQIAPPLPMRPWNCQSSSPMSYSSPYGNNYGFGNSSFGFGGYNSFNSFGNYGGFNNYGRPAVYGNPLDPDMRFIQMAEESSRGAFQSIESIVCSIGNIASMLDSTYFALTSSFRAILGLATNFSHLRGFFARFFSTFTIFKSLIYIYKKLLYFVGLSKTNPSAQINLNEAFQDAEKVNSNDFFNTSSNSTQSSGLAMVLFLTFIFTAPYFIMKLFGSLMNTAADQSKNPSTWLNPIDAVALYNFNADHPSELTIKSGQTLKIAPKEVQQMNHLLSTNWLLATSDGNNVGLVPVNYIKRSEVNFSQTTFNAPPSEMPSQIQRPINSNNETIESPASIPKNNEDDSMSNEIIQNENLS